MLNPVSSTTRWSRVGLFVGLTFALTLALDLLIWVNGGLNNSGVGVALQAQMLLPAFVAIGLGLFVFTDGPIHLSRVRGQAKIFLIGYLVFTLIFLALAAAGILMPSMVTVISAVSGLFNIAALLAVVLLRLIGGRESFRKAGLTFGRPIHWLVFGGGLALVYVLNTVLNWVFNLGTPVNPALLVLSLGVPMSPTLLMILLVVQGALLGPFLGLLLAFGEEYGWRGFLQSELIKFGRRRGILLLGVIWGAWHWPLIWMGYNYPGEPVLGTILMTLYTIALAFVFGYAVLKTGSVWLAAFIHAVNNQVLSTLMSLFYTPNSMIYSFGIGIYGLILMALVVALILRDPVWRETGPAPFTPEAGEPEIQPTY
ncbi:MAG TPA: CPBP family intramembrane metalloprotease [Chloroflexi bacterium]|jgi:membrane protease YdiL (CAAX protease family)|nr:CPBP family intramembrane metalloprotease [Chloroflexota bacterium]HPO59399.1 CPBP family intramembrane metalloprotease [Anaerolineaceae bacterium]